jgi:hypothetical protein
MIWNQSDGSFLVRYLLTEKMNFNDKLVVLLVLVLLFFLTLSLSHRFLVVPVG